jgi:hypothetical protein
MSRPKCSPYTGVMAEAYDSALDRTGAFNAVTEKLAKRRASEITVTVAAVVTF